ncbi:MAG: 2,3-bisphosphoglycerate-independent phosphoglycerate mutase [Tissierellia bacterium]|nr:2,3-bisphosphoglycerate-independent phosphoglycerate mutase [Tissierellia bacterium]
MADKTTMLIIMDGYGIGKSYPGNAIKAANKPNIDRLMREYKNTEIEASGVDVGLPEGQMGNSEVGHLNMGAGRIIFQDLLKINNDIKSGEFAKNKIINRAIENSIERDNNLHLMGLLSPGGVHSHEEHLFSLLRVCKELGKNKNVYIHAFLDGRDVDPHYGEVSIKKLKEEIEKIGLGEIASLSGRYYAMDRDKHWDRIQLAYDVMVNGKGKKGEDAEQIIKDSYARGVTDEFIEPTFIEKSGKACGLIEENDTVIMFNFRPDRAREIIRTLADPEFDGFDSKDNLNLDIYTMTEYDKTIPNVNVIYSDEAPKNTLGEYASKLGLNQLRIAETEKYAHVTFFFNGGTETPFENEDRILVKSPAVPTFDLKPEMSAYEVTDKVCEAIKSKKYDLIILNYANCDMVGHTGSIPAAIKAVEAVDENLGRLTQTLKELNGSALITADHGNAEVMLNDEGNPVTSHTTNPVPLILFNYPGYKLKEGGRLADLSPTLLDMMNIEKPEEMTGNSLLEKEEE